MQHLIALLDRKTGKKQKDRPRFIKQDNIAIARLQTTGVVCIEKFADFPQMGRFTLRDEGTVRMSFTLIDRKNTFEQVVSPQMFQLLEAACLT